MRQGERPEVADALIALLVRALGLSRAALLIERAAGEPFLTVAAHGRVRLRNLLPDAEPGDGPWSARIPIRVGERTEAHTYIGITQHIAGNVDEALTHFNWVIRQGARNYTEYELAKDEIRRIERASAPPVAP